MKISPPEGTEICWALNSVKLSNNETKCGHTWHLGVFLLFHPRSHFQI